MPVPLGRGQPSRGPSAFTGVKDSDAQLERELKREIDAKDRRMRQLQEQVSGLLKYKEDCHHYRSECVILNERLRVRDDDHKKLEEGIQGIFDASDGKQTVLEERCVKLERANEMLKRHMADKVQSLEDYVLTLKNDAQRQGEANDLLQGELMATQRCAQQERTAYETREVKRNQAQIHYEEQIALLRSQLYDRESASTRIEAEVRSVRDELLSKEASLKDVVASEAKTESRNAELQAKGAQLTQQLSAAEERVRMLSLETEDMPALRQELSEASRERQELRQQVKQLEECQHQERQQAQRLDEQLRRTQERCAEAESLLARERENADDASTLRDELAALRKEASETQESLTAEQRRAEHLAAELESARKEGKDNDTKATALLSSLEHLLHTASTVAAAVFDDKPHTLCTISDADPRTDSLPTALRREVVDLRQRVAALCAECTRLRAQSDSCRERVSTQQNLAEQVRRDRDDLLRERETLLERHEDARRIARAAEENARKTESELGVWRAKADTLQEQLRIRCEALLKVLKQFSARQGDKSAPGPEVIEHPPALRLGTSPGDEHALSFDTLLWKLQDFMTTHDQYAQRLRTRLEGMYRRVDEAEGVALEAKRGVVHTTEVLRYQLHQEEERRAGEIRALREKLEARYSGQLSTATARLRAVEKDAVALRHEKEEALLGLQSADAEGEKLQQQCRRAVAEIEQFRRRWEAAEERRAATERENESEHKRADQAEAAVRELTNRLTGAETEIGLKEELLGEVRAMHDAQAEKAAEERRRLQAEVDALRRATESTARRLDEAERESIAAEARAGHWKQERGECEAELQETRRLRSEAAAEANASSAQVARLLACVKVLARALAPLREECRELKWQRRVMTQWTHQLTLAFHTLMGETRRALVDAGGSFPTSKERTVSFRTAAIAALAAGRLARLGRRPAGPRLVAVRGLDTLPLLPPEAALGIEAGDIPYPPSNAKAVSEGGRVVGWLTSVREDGDGVVDIVDAFIARGRVCERGQLMRRLTAGFHYRSQAPRSPAEVARCFASELGLRVRDMRICAMETRRELDEREEEGNAAVARIARLNDGIRSRESRIASLETHVEQLNTERQFTVPVEHANELASALDSHKAELAAARREQGYKGAEVEQLRSELKEERRMKTELAMEHRNLAEVHDQTSRALRIQREEGHQLTDFLQLKAKETVNTARRLHLDASARPVPLCPQPVSVLKKPAVFHVDRSASPTEPASRTRSPVRPPSGGVSSGGVAWGEVRSGDRVCVDVVSAETGQVTDRRGTVVCGPSGIPASVYVRLDGDAGAARFFLSDIRPIDGVSPRSSPPPAVVDSVGLSEVTAALYRSGFSSPVGAVDTTRPGAADPMEDVTQYISALNRRVDRTLQMSRSGINAGKHDSTLTMGHMR